MVDEQSQTGSSGTGPSSSGAGPSSSGSFSIVRAAAVLIVFVVAVTVLVSVGTRSSVSGTPTTTTIAKAAGTTTTSTTAAAGGGSTTTTTTKAGKKGAAATTTTTAPHRATSVVVANATTTSGLAAHYSTVIGAGGWTMKTPVDASSSEATSAVYYVAGQQEAAASIATTIGVEPTQVLRSRRPRRSTGSPAPTWWWSSARSDLGHDDDRPVFLTLPAAGDAAAGLPALLQPLAAEPDRSALFLDFDGTLAAIVEDPTAARPLPGVPALLAALAPRFALVAVISGRPPLSWPRSWARRPVSRSPASTASSAHCPGPPTAPGPP